MITMPLSVSIAERRLKTLYNTNGVFYLSKGKSHRDMTSTRHVAKKFKYFTPALALKLI